MALDLIIRGGTVVDGTGRPGFPADVGVDGRQIAAAGNLSAATAAQTVDADGMVVCPGFIDVHTHSDLTLLVNGRAESKIRQGVTTEVTGNCSYSPYPLRPERPEMLERYELLNALRGVGVDWTDLDGYALRMGAAGIAVNIAPLVGHSAIRIAVMGAGEGAPTAEQLAEMEQLTAEAMEQGAFGFSVGLTLVPSTFATTDELVALSRVAGRYGRPYVQHSRVWADCHEKTIHEAIQVGREAGCGVQISHQAIIDSRHYGEAPQQIAIMEHARDEGVDIMYDVYPYVAAGTILFQLLPLWVQDGGIQAMLRRLDDPAVRRRAVEDTKKGWFGGLPFDWTKLLLTEVGREESLSYLGWSIQQVADDWQMEPTAAAIELIVRERNRVGVVMFNRDESDMRSFLRHPLGMVGSDGSAIAPYGPFANSKPHPRFYGTHPRILGRYVREARVLSLESAIHKMTGLPAMRFGMKDRGTIDRGKAADLVVFDPATVVDRATFESPHNYPVGIRDVFVAGQAVITNEEHTGALPGKVLRAGS
ncbi:MAG: D-aminoacylase [Chloroflexi bacterium]|nr:D-aminoacylase [Chloroflexota bacterium]